MNAQKLKKLQAAVTAARVEYAQAMEVSKQVAETVLASGYYIDEDNGERIVQANLAYAMSDADFSVFLDHAYEEYQRRGINNPRDKAYDDSFRKAVHTAEEALLDACDEHNRRQRACPTLVKESLVKIRNHWKRRGEYVELCMRLVL